MKTQEFNFTPPKMYPKQAAIFNSRAKYKIIPKGRRAGFTKAAAAYLIANALAGKIKRALWVDVRHVNIDKYYEIYFKPLLLQIPRDVWTYRQVKKQLVIVCGSDSAIIDFGSAENPEGIEGFGYQTIILNEAGIILKDESLWSQTILPMLMDYPDTEVFVGGTPRGKNLFHKLALKAENTPGWELFNITPYDNPYLNPGQLQDVEETILPRFKDQELYGKFMDDGGTVFRGLSNCIKGELELPQPGKFYRGGLDLARKSDYTVICILDQHNHLCGYHRMGNIDWAVQKTHIRNMIRRYGAPTLADSTGVGDPVISDLQDMGVNITGYQFTSKSKVQLIDNLSIGIEKGEISFPELPDLIRELESYEFDQGSSIIKYGTQSEHDDIVTALALAYWQTSHYRPLVYRNISADELAGRKKRKSIFEMEREYEKTGSWKTH